MFEKILFPLTLISALGCGLNVGLFFVFSNTVMTALGRLQPAHGIAAMQSINSTILNPLFYLVFFGTAITSLCLGTSLIWRWQHPDAVYILAGCLFYIVGSVLVTIFFNVPMNEALDAVKPESVEAANFWSRYLKNWTAWNHVRTMACLLGSSSFIFALCKYS